MFKTPANPLHTLPLLVKKCKTLLQFKSIHAYILKSHLSPLSISHLFTLTSLPTHTHLLSIFHTLTHRNTFIYNSMIRSFTHNNSPLPAILYYLDMLNFGLIPNNYTYPPLIKACSVLEDLSTWKLVHSHVVKFGYCDDLFVVSSLVELYSRISDMETARRLFDEMPQRDVVLWTVMIDGYGKMGDVENARKLFDEMPQRNVVSWSAMMAGYSRVSDFKQVLCLFGEMQKLGVKPNESVLVTVLTACGNLGALAQGLWVHSYVKQQRKFESNTILGTAITDMFAKCGATDAALLAFDGIKDKDVGAWNAIICGVAMNGDAMRSLELFNKMWTNRAQPNETTFIAILTACTHAGLVDEGLRLFDQMGGLFKLNPRLEHYACIVDLLARAGKLEEAEKFVEERIGGLGEGDANVWGALLGACRTYGNVEVGNRVWKKLAGLGVADSGTYMILYNMYKESGWEMEANQAIRSIKEKGIKKQPGCSSIEVDGMVDEFIAGDLSHPQAKNMSETLQSLVNLMNSEFVSIENMPVKFVF